MPWKPTPKAGAIALVALGLVLRLWGIDTYWLNPDEGIYHAIAHLPDWSAFWAEVAVNAHPPLFYLLLRGVGFLSSEPLMLRLPALLFGVLGVHAFYLLGRRLCGEAAGLWMAAIAALAPGLIVLSQVARPYTMQVALLAYALWLGLRALETRRGSDALGFGAVLLAAMLTHYGSIVVVAALGVLLGAAVLRRSLPLREAARLGVAIAVPALAFVALYALHVSPYFVGSKAPLWLGMEGFKVAYAHMLHADLASLWSGLVGVHFYVFGPRLGALASVLFLSGLWAGLRRREFLWPAVGLACLGFAAALSLAQRYPFGASRHSLYLAVVLVPCVSEGLRWLLQRRLRAAVPIGAVLLLLAANPGPLGEILRAPPLRMVPEKLTPTAVVEKQERALEAARTKGGVLVFDKQVYFMLMPKLRLPYPHDVRDAPEVMGELRIGRTRWGEAELLVSSAWVFDLDPQELGRPRHIVAFLSAAQARFPELDLPQRRDGLLLFGGWNVKHYRSLLKINPKLGKDPCFSDLDASRGLGSARIDFESCLRHRAPR